MAARKARSSSAPEAIDDMALAVKLLPAEHRLALCFAINQFGDEGPTATQDNLAYFKLPFARACVEKAIKHHNVSESAKSLLGRVRDALAAADSERG